MLALEPGSRMQVQPKRGVLALWGFAVFAFSFCVQLTGMSRVIVAYDECLELFAAVRVLHGDVPYRDFWTMYGPAQFYVIAGIFKVFGVSVMVARFYNAFAGACVVLLLFVLARKFMPPLFAAVVSLFAVLWATGVLFLTYEFPTYPALALTLASVLLLTPLFEDRVRPLPIAMSGLCVALVTLFRHDFGFYVFLCEFVMIIARDLRLPGSTSGTFHSWRGNLRQSAWYLVGMAAVLVPSAIVILKAVSWHDLYFDLIYVPGRIYPKVRSLPFPKPMFLLSCLKHRVWLGTEQAIDYFPICVGMTSIAYLAVTRHARKTEIRPQMANRRLHILLTMLLVMMTIKGLVRVSPVQLIQAILLAILVLAILLVKTWQTHRVIRLLCVACLIVAALPTFTVSASVASRSLANVKDALGFKVDSFPGVPGGVLQDSCRVQPGLERMRCFYLDPFEVQAIQYIQAHTSPSDTIYVGAGRHDRLWLNDLAFYFVSKRMSGTKWHDLHPGIETTQEIQDQMVADLQRSQTKYVVLETSWDNEDEPNQSRFSSGVYTLDEFIHENYQQVAQFGPISVLKQK